MLHKMVKKDKSELTVERLKEVFPKKKNTITQELADKINAAIADPKFDGDEFLDTMLSYQNVMQKNGSSLENYMNAVKFCAYLQDENMNYTQAYILTFNHREFGRDRMGANTESPEYAELTSAASRYRRSPLVKDILIQSDMPLYLMFQGARYRAVSVLANEMETAAYAKDRISAADKLLQHVKPPEDMKIELEVGPNAEAIELQKNLADQIGRMAEAQMAAYHKGEDLRKIQKVGIDVVEATVVEE